MGCGSSEIVVVHPQVQENSQKVEECSKCREQNKMLNLNNTKKLYCDSCQSMILNEKQLSQQSVKGIRKQQILPEKLGSDELILSDYQKNEIQFKSNCQKEQISNNDISNNLCQNCDWCNCRLFSDYIQIKKCNHNFHFLCAFMLIDPHNLQSLRCNCGQFIDDEETKIQLNIICLICGKCDNNLKLLDCQHYIHLDCIQNNSIKFSNFKCYTCEIPILNFLSNPDHKYINDIVKQKNQEMYHFQFESNCFICQNQSSEILLLNTSCNHKVHLSCLRKRQSEIEDKREQYIKCLCGQQINIGQIAN